MSGIQPTTIYDASDNSLTNRTLDDLWRALSFIYSRESLGLQTRTIDSTIPASRLNMDNRDAVVFVNGTAAGVAIVLPPANSWGSGKTPLIVLVRVDASVNACTYAPSGADTINGAGGALAINGLGTVKRLVTDGLTGYWLI